MCKDNQIDAGIGIGGGSAIDSAKAIAALAKADTDNCWNLVRARKPITDALPVYAIPTCGAGGVIRGFVDLTLEDVVNIYRMCL